MSKQTVLKVTPDFNFFEGEIEVVLFDVLENISDDEFVKIESEINTIYGNMNNAENLPFLIPDYTTSDYKRDCMLKINKILRDYLATYFTPFVENNYINCDIDFTVTGIDYIEGVESVECWHCGLKHLKSYPYEVYDYPSQTEPNKIHLCSYYCYDSIQGINYSKDFNYRECEECGRMICEQSPSNGYLTQFKLIDCELICNDCHSKRTYENGIDEQLLIEGKIQSNWHTDSELEEHGFKMYNSYFVTDIDQFYGEIKHLFENHLVIVKNTSLSILGDEGYVSVWIKEKLVE